MRVCDEAERRGGDPEALKKGGERRRGERERKKRERERGNEREGTEASERERKEKENEKKSLASFLPSSPPFHREIQRDECDT